MLNDIYDTAVRQRKARMGCGLQSHGKILWRKNLRLGLDAQVDKCDRKNNTNQMWSRSLVIICNDLVDDNPSFMSIFQ